MPSRHPAHPSSCDTAPLDDRDCRDTNAINSKRVHSCRLVSLPASNDAVPRRLPTSFYVPADSAKSTPEGAKGINLKVLASNLSILTLDVDDASSSNIRAIGDDILRSTLWNPDPPTPYIGQSAPALKPHELGHSNHPTGILATENISRSPNSIKTTIRKRSTHKARRKRNTSDDQQEEDEDNGAGDGDDDGVPHDAVETRPSSSPPMACPYRKRDRKTFNYRTHRECTEAFTNMTTVKQHLKNYHSLEDSEPSRPGRQSFEDGITPSIEARLGTRASKLKINTWEKLWVLLFGEGTNIPSPDYEPCHIFEHCEIPDLFRQFLDRILQHQASGLENFCSDNLTKNAVDNIINDVLSPHLASQEIEEHVTNPNKHKGRGKKRSSAVNTGSRTDPPQATTIQSDQTTLRRLAPKVSASNTPTQLPPHPLAGQEIGSFSRATANSIAPFNPVTLGSAPYTIDPTPSSLRRSARLTPQTPPSVYPPAPSPGSWNASGHHDQHQFERYQYAWAPTADDFAQELNEEKNSRA
ncbi:hypothetical protein QBC40DRAFT_263684 [Triangularia verruculosa]|uniref:C2H2-type domain-containing protein n=1 Tax=Triangularia verruculosa TaxID=2587418 RepID=A0AAN6XML6_9PEZI|nr:hypothetical protein QBC40DRAFT_263684 [Triangularia verruculosa]